MLRIWLLGAFRVEAAGRPVAEARWRLRKARAVVKLLALDPTHRLQRDRLLDLLWPDLPPDAAANNLRYALHVARRALSAGAEADRDAVPEAAPAPPTYLRSVAEQVALSADGGVWTDVAAFESAAAAARRSGDPALFAAAAAHYGGELLPEDPYEDWVTGRRESLRALHLTLLLEQATAAAAAGDTAGAAAALERVLASDPANEGAHQGLMRLYAGAGQRQEALRQYRRLESALRQELDAGPDATSRRLLAEILDGGPPAPSGPGGDGPGAGAGAAGATAPGPGADGARPEAAHPVRRHNLPTPITSFVGREAEVAELTRLLAAPAGAAGREAPRLVTLTGSGGCGKTRLALEVARDLVGRPAYADGVWLVELGSLADPGLLGQAVAAALGVREAAGQAVLDTLARALAERRLLLVLDNCEHLLDACAGLADALLRACPGVRILATSRQALGMPGEVTYRVPSLALPESTPATAVEESAELERLAGYAAVRLFVERASFGQPGFALSAQNVAAVVQICRRLDGIPLAIELAAARLLALSSAQLATRLDDRFRLLTSGNRAAPERHQTLRAVVDWSYGLLTPAERALFARLAVFAGGFTLDAAEAVCAGDDLDPADVLDLLSQLVEKSLAEASEDAAGQVRYRLPETLREYARERLDADPAAAGARRRHAAFYTDLAVRGEAALAGPAQGDWLRRLAPEHDNLRAALRAYLDERDVSGALRLGAALGRFWTMRGDLREGRERLADVQALAAAAGEASGAAAPPGARAKVLYTAGFLAWRQGDAAAARPLLEAAVAVATAAGDGVATGYALFYLGLVPQFQGDYPAARGLFEDSRRAFEAAGDPEGLALALFGLGNLSRQVGEDGPAQALLERSLALFREQGDRRSLALPLGYLGRVALRTGDPVGARVRLEEALAIVEDIGETWLVASVLDSLAEVARCEDDQARAERLLGRSLALWRELGSTGTQTQGALHQLGHVALARGDAARADGLFRESLTLARAQGNKRHVATALAGLACVAAATGQPETAARLFGAAGALRRAVGAALSPADRIAHRRAEARARAAAGAAAFAAARAAGAQAPIEAVLDGALAAARPPAATAGQALPR